jgi:hypothetical protein
MPWNKVLHKFKAGTLHSGSKSGPVVKSQKQAVAIMLSEKRKAASKPEYRSKGYQKGTASVAGPMVKAHLKRNVALGGPVADFLPTTPKPQGQSLAAVSGFNKSPKTGVGRVPRSYPLHTRGYKAGTSTVRAYKNRHCA